MLSIKEKLIQEIESSENHSLLETLYNIITKDDKDVVELDAADVALVKEAQEEYKKGETIAHKELKKEFLEWKKK